MSPKVVQFERIVCIAYLAQRVALNFSENFVTCKPQLRSSLLLQVIVIFTDGLFSPLDNETFPTARLLELRVKVILYKFPGRNDDLDPFLNTTTLRNILCGVNGTFELLDAVYSVNNPLYAIRSFYTFMARTQLAVVNNNATWSDWYLSYSQPLNGTSVTYPGL